MKNSHDIDSEIAESFLKYFIESLRKHRKSTQCQIERIKPNGMIMKAIFKYTFIWNSARWVQNITALYQHRFTDQINTSIINTNNCNKQTSTLHSMPFMLCLCSIRMGFSIKEQWQKKTNLFIQWIQN